MTALHRAQPIAGPVLGIAVDNDGKTLNIRAHKAVIVGTGGSTSNVNFRRMFDPRLTEEYCGVAGSRGRPRTPAASSPAWRSAHRCGAPVNFTGEFGDGHHQAGHDRRQYGYVNLRWYPGSEVFDKARATGLHVEDWQDLVLVNMIGNRFYDETARQFTAGQLRIDAAL